jgi:hypothetical protein
MPPWAHQRSPLPVARWRAADGLVDLMNMVDTARCAAVAGWVTERMAALIADHHRAPRLHMQTLTYDVDGEILTRLLDPARPMMSSSSVPPTEHDALSMRLPDLRSALTEFLVRVRTQYPSCHFDAAVALRTCAPDPNLVVTFNVIAADGRKVDEFKWAATG